MILCRSHDPDGLAIYKGKYTDFSSGHKLFDDHTITSRTEFLVQHDLIHACQSFLQRIADQYAFSQCQAVCLQHGRETCLLLQIFDGILRIIEILIGCGRNIIFFHKILGKSLAALQDCCIFTGSESTQALCLQCIYQSAYQRIVHTYDGQVNGLFLRKSNDLVKFHGSDGNTFCDLTDSGIARSTIDLIYLRTLCNTGCNGMLSATATYDQYFHTHIMFLLIP